MPESWELKLTAEEIESRLASLDYAIFERLPTVGQVLGYHPMLKSTRQLGRELNDPLPPEARISPGALGTRLRLLKHAGLVVDVSKSFSNKKDGWQRTARAVELLEAHKRETGSEG